MRSQANATETVVRLRQLTKVFVTEKVETHALSEVSLDVGRGEYLLVRGPSGCGKSTLLSILGLLDTPSSGRYSLLGADTEKLSLAARAHLRNRELGFVFQSFNLIGDLTIRENVELPLRYRRGVMKTTAIERRERAEALLDQVGIANRRDHYPAQLSGGQQQRAAIARAFVGDPSLLLADEPTGNLDSDSEDIVVELLADCHAQGKTVCVVSHNPKFIEAAGRVVTLTEGRLTH